MTKDLQYRKKNSVKMARGLLILPMPYGRERETHYNKFSSNMSLVITGYASGFGLGYCGRKVTFPTKYIILDLFVRGFSFIKQILLLKLFLKAQGVESQHTSRLSG